MTKPLTSLQENTQLWAGDILHLNDKKVVLTHNSSPEDKDVTVYEYDNPPVMKSLESTKGFGFIIQK